MAPFFFIARAPFSELIVETWTQSVPESMLKDLPYVGRRGKPTMGKLPLLSLLSDKMRRGHRPEDLRRFPLLDDGRPDMPLDMLREIPSYTVSSRATIGLLWVDLEHTLYFRDDAVQDLRERGLEEPTSVQEFLALGYEVEQIESIELSGFSTRIEKVKVNNIYDAITQEKPNLCLPDSPWLIEVFNLEYNDDLHELESEARLVDLNQALLDIEEIRAGQKLDMIKTKFPKEFARITSLPVYKKARRVSQQVRVLCRQSEEIELAERRFKVPVAEVLLYEDLVLGGQISNLRFPQCKDLP